jgi:hypothetical protein
VAYFKYSWVAVFLWGILFGVGWFRSRSGPLLFAKLRRILCLFLLAVEGKFLCGCYMLRLVGLSLFLLEQMEAWEYLCNGNGILAQ